MKKLKLFDQWSISHCVEIRVESRRLRSQRIENKLPFLFESGILIKHTTGNNALILPYIPILSIKQEFVSMVVMTVALAFALVWSSDAPDKRSTGISCCKSLKSHLMCVDGTPVIKMLSTCAMFIDTPTRPKRALTPSFNSSKSPCNTDSLRKNVPNLLSPSNTYAITCEVITLPLKPAIKYPHRFEKSLSRYANLSIL